MTETVWATKYPSLPVLLSTGTRETCLKCKSDCDRPFSLVSVVLPCSRLSPRSFSQCPNLSWSGPSLTLDFLYYIGNIESHAIFLLLFFFFPGYSFYLKCCPSLAPALIHLALIHPLRLHLDVCSLISHAMAVPTGIPCHHSLVFLSFSLLASHISVHLSLVIRIRPTQTGWNHEETCRSSLLGKQELIGLQGWPNLEDSAQFLYDSSVLWVLAPSSS